MRICLVSDNLIGYHDAWSGAEMIVQYLTSLLKKEKKNKDIALLTIKSKKKETPPNVFPIPALNSPFWFFKKIIPVHILIRTIAAFLQIKKIKPDILHFFHSNSLFIPVMLSAKILKIPATFTVLDYWLICPTGHLLLKNGQICPKIEGKVCLKCISPLHFLQRRFVRSLAKDLKYLVTFTETSKKRLTKHGFSPEKIRVKYIYEFNLESFSKNQNKIAGINDVLAICSSFGRQKGLEIIIRAMPGVVAKNPNARLLVIGRGTNKDKERIENLIKELKLKRAVRFLGQKTNEETLKIMAQSKVVVVAEQWYSDFGPITLIEAMARGRPVVAGNIGSAADFIKDGFNGFLVEYNKPKEFAEKIIQLLQDKPIADEMGNRAKKSIQLLFGPQHNKEILKLYSKI